MPLTARIRSLIAAFETERAEVDALRYEVEERLTALPERLRGLSEHEALREKQATLDLIHSRLNDIVFDLYHLIGEETNGN